MSKILLILLVLGLFVGCSEFGETPPESPEAGENTAVLSFEKTNLGVELNTDGEVALDNVKIEVSGTDMDTIVQDLDIKVNEDGRQEVSGKISDIPVGDERRFSVEGYVGENLAMYGDLVTDVREDKNVIIFVIIIIIEKPCTDCELEDPNEPITPEDDSLVLHLDFETIGYDVTKGEEFIPDLSGHGNNAYVHGVTFPDNSAMFDGESYLQITDKDESDLGTLDISNELTVMMMVKPEEGPGYCELFWNRTPFNGYSLQGFTQWEGSNFVLCDSADCKSRYFATELVKNGEWTHIAVTMSGGTTLPELKYYINGELVELGTIDKVLTASNDVDAFIGAGYSDGEINPAGFYVGLMDEIKVYKRALSASEILAEVNGNIIEPHNVVFDEGQNLSNDTFETKSIALGDVNSDGNLDVIEGNWAQVNRVYLGNGDGTFKSGMNISEDEFQTISIKVADINNDGKLDVVAGHFKNPPQVFLGKDDGTFKAGINVGADDTLTHSIDIGDVNNDGNLDIVTGNGNLPVNLPNRVFLGKGDGTFDMGNDIAGESKRTFAIALADFNEDEKLDVISINFDQPPRINLGNGNGTFQAGIDVGEDIYFGYAVDLGDVNNDGHVDVLIANHDHEPERLFLGNGDGSFKNGKNVSYDTLQTASVAFGDLNNDGLLDIVNGGVLFSRFYLNNGDNTFVDGVEIDAENYREYNTQSIALGDLNNDGKLDVVTGNDHLGGYADAHNRIYLQQ